MDKQNVLVTGGNSGIGFECARELARQGYHVTIASRNKEASESALQRIRKEGGSESASSMHLDLGSLDSVRSFAQQIRERNLTFFALVCNAGIQLNATRRRSPEGYELTFAVNHLGHFLLVNLLLDRLQREAPARIVVVASGVHDPKLKTGMPKARYESIEDIATTGGSPEDAYNGQLAYVNSKLCNLWFVYELDRRLKAAGLSNGGRTISVNGYDPGLVPGSGLARDYPAALRFIWNGILPGVARLATLFTPTINPAPKSGKALARLVFDPNLEGVTGKYFPSHSRWAEAASSDASYDEDLARELWEFSVRASGLREDESPLARASSSA